ncbi:MAG: hypothetical protein JWM55_605 [Acidimicrobiaceae bacterium]|nr:hypothetical protein [Acidimicrobiaceae bacterium]
MTTQRIGYGRVSTRDQNTNDQEDALGKANVDRIFVEKFTGTKASRPKWNEVKDLLREGDTLVITRLDRLGRSSKDLHDIAAFLKDKGVNLEATQQPIDTSTSEGKMFFSILAAFAEFEHDIIVARTMDGLAAARARGRNGGRKPKISPSQATAIRNRYEDGEAVQALADSFNTSRPTIYRALESTPA